MDTSSKLYTPLLLVTSVLGLVIIFYGLGTPELMSLNEGRRALAIKEMFQGGDWLLPHLNGELYLSKPPLLYWIAVSFACISGGVNEWIVRLPSALAAVAILCMMYKYAAKNFGAWPALFTVQLLLINASFAMLARRAEIEMLLTCLCVGSLLSALIYIQEQGGRRWIYLSYFLLALAVLTKGPVALLFVTLPLIASAVWLRDTRVKDVLTSIPGWAILLLVGMSWYAVVTWQLGPDIWAQIARKDMLGKMQAEEVAKPLLSYLGWIAVDFLLLVVLLLVKPKAWFISIKDRKECIVLVMAILLPLLVFSLFSNKHTKYLLPVYPFIALVLATRMAGLYKECGAKPRLMILVAGIMLPLLYAIYYAFVEQKYFDYRVSAFPLFHAWTTGIPQPNLYAYNGIDSRLIYYSAKPVNELNENQLAGLKIGHQSALILVEGTTSVGDVVDCRLKEFKPYLKKHKSLVVYGIGAACHG